MRKILLGFTVGAAATLAACHYMRVLAVIHEVTGGRSRGIEREWRDGRVYDWSRN